MSEMVKVQFALQQDEDGWPPVESEGMWAEPIDGELYRLANASWFVRGVAAEDVIEARPEAEEVLWFRLVQQRGGRLVIRLIPRKDGPLQGDAGAVIDTFAELGVGGEVGLPLVNIVALDVGPDAHLPSVKSLLVAGEADGRWYYEEGCITDDWRQL